MKNKIVGNKIGNLINVFINGNAYQKTFDSQKRQKNFSKLCNSHRKAIRKRSSN